MNLNLNLRKKLYYIYAALAVAVLVMWYQHPVAMAMLGLVIGYLTIRDMFKKRSRSGPTPRRNPVGQRTRRD